jgi:CheY-like chemotaxis protein
LGCLVLFLVALLVVSGTLAISLPDYDKIVQIRLTPADSGYQVSSMEMRYGSAPHLDVKTGVLNGKLLDAGGNELSSFALRDPGIVQADILGPPGSDSLIGYTGTAGTGGMTITVPYLPDMKTFRLSDTRSGAVLVTADLASPVTLFCTDYPMDPDCLIQAAPQNAAAPDSSTMFVLATIFSASVIMAAGLAIMTIRRRAAASVVTALPGKGPEKQTVLVVDDDPDMVEVIRQFLDMEGYATISASSGRECLDILRHQVPDLVLLDVLMAPMNGWQTLEQIKNDPKTKPIPVLMLTGKRLTSAEARQYNICIDDYITKPFRHEEIFAAIDNILQRKKRLKENLVLAKEAGLDREEFCELARLSRRISVNKKIITILQGPEGVPAWAEPENYDDRAVIEQISDTTRVNEKRVEQLRKEINLVFRSKGLPEINL